MNIDWTTTLQLLAPELILLVGGLAVLVIDMLVRDARHPALSWTTYGTLLLGWLATLGLMVGTPGGIAPLAVPGAFTLGLFQVDSLTNFFRILVLATSLLVMMVSTHYVRRRSRHAGEFYGLLLFLTAAVTLVAGSTDLIMLYLCFEFLSITSYIMVGWLRDETTSNEAAIKYLLYGAISSALMLYGMSLLYGAAGSTQFSAVATVFSQGALSPGLIALALPALVLMLTGFGFKIALVPFHQWSPDAYEGAPTPVAAFLSVGSKAAGFAVLIRVLLTALPAYAESWQTILAIIAILSMTLGNLVALMQTNMKRMLAYSSIAQAGYVLMGLVAYGATFDAVSASGEGMSGIGGLLVYLLAYLFTNLGAFVAVIAYEEATGSVTVSDYAGMAQRAPWLAGALVVFLLSLAGIPPTAGFIGKFFVFGAAVTQGFYFLALVGVINSVISVAYYFNIMRQMFFRPDPTAGAETVRYPPSLNLALSITVAVTLLMGLYPEPFLLLANAGQGFLGSAMVGR